MSSAAGPPGPAGSAGSGTGDQAPIVLVGNRMLGIMALAAAGAALLPAADRFGPLRYAVAVLALVVGVLYVMRRVELHPGQARWRTVWRQRSCPRSELAVELDHRFLRLRAPGRPTVRIEVPAELRPEVRTWASPESNRRL